MVEILEYIVVFAVTAAVAGFSIFVFGGSVPQIHTAQGESEVSQVAGAVDLAAADGNSSLSLTLSNASLSCSQGSVDLTMGGQTYSSSVASACSFTITGLSCTCDLSFTRGPEGVGLEVGA